MAGQLRNAVTAEVVQEWRDEAGVEIYDINGDEIEPASGEETDEGEMSQQEPAAAAESTPEQDDADQDTAE